MDAMLQFRRQFLLTIAPITPLADWKCSQIDQYYLYAHPDLEVNRVADSKKSIVLIGSLFDSAEPEKDNADIIHDILASANCWEEYVARIKRYAGNHALLYKDNKITVILHDALALREIYYCTKENQIVCGSQPNLVAKFANPEIKPTSDPDLLDFYKNHLKNSIRIGDETYYEGVKHLLPNHCLDINRREARRYWPNEPIKRLALDEAVSKSCTYLQGVLKAMAHRHPPMMAVTAGTDSRVMLAASKGIQDKIYYFINNHSLGHSHPDISVPKKIFESIRVPFHVHDVPMDVDDEFKRIYIGNTFFTTKRLLTTIYNVYFKNHGEKINITGTGEIGRTRYGKEPKHLNSYLIAYKLGYTEGCRYVIKQSEKILDEMLSVARHFGINILTLLYWEQMIGNWGTVVNSESDIAIEEFDPFDSHMLYEIFLGVDEKYTKYDQTLCVFFRDMIRNMWPELLGWPINPPHIMRDKVSWLLRKAGMFELLKELKYQMSYAMYKFKRRFKSFSNVIHF